MRKFFIVLFLAVVFTSCVTTYHSNNRDFSIISEVAYDK